jgi:hypothetical protein
MDLRCQVSKFPGFPLVSGGFRWLLKLSNLSKLKRPIPDAVYRFGADTEGNVEMALRPLPRWRRRTNVKVEPFPRVREGFAIAFLRRPITTGVATGLGMENLKLHHVHTPIMHHA